MNGNDSIFSTKKMTMIVIFIIIFFLAAFAPSICVFLIVVSLIIFKFPTDTNAYGIFLLLLLTWLYFNAIDVTSYANFVYSSDDFSTYYNNYLGFLSFGFNERSLFEFGNIEIGLPLINYVLSLVINGATPYKLKFAYALLQGVGVLFCCFKIAKYYDLNFQKKVLLVALTLIFYKPLVAIQLSRQVFSTIFIVGSIFTRGNYKKVLFLIIAFLFHSSTLILLPITIFLFRQRSKRSFLITLIIVISSYIIIQVAYSILRTSLIELPIFNKLDYVIRSIAEPDKIKLSILTSLLLICYLIPILFKIATSKTNVNMKYNIYIILSILICFCSFPGLNNRILLPELYIFLGYFYYVIFFSEDENNKGFSRLFIVLCFSFLFVQSHVNQNIRRFDNVIFEPFHYLDYISEEVGLINRDILE